MSDSHEPGFVSKYIFSTDHKMIAKQFLLTGFVFMAIGGTLAMIIRWQWAYPGHRVPLFGIVLGGNGAVTPPMFNVLFTMHGLIMIFWAITPIIIGAFGNFCIPLLIGARDMAFPRLNMLSFWTFILSGVLVIAAFFTELGASAGWTTYPPLSGPVGTPGWGQSLMVLALFVTGVATIMGAINYVVTVIRLRAPGMGFFRMPLTIWGMWFTAILNLVFVPFLASGGLLLLLDRLVGTQFFSARGGEPLLFQHLFWIFGHPEVYILILPVWGVVGDLVSYFSRKPAFWYRGTVYAMLSVTTISGLVYGHHMYVSGMSPLLGLGFEALTLAISFPAVILFSNWLCTLWKGSIRTTPPMLFALGTIFVFGLGGLTGLLLGTISTDVVLHDTMYVVGHFHLTLAAATFLGSFTAVYFWFPKMYGRTMNVTLGKFHFWGSTIFIVLTFGTMLLAGYAGQQRRLYNPFVYEFLKRLAPLNRYTTYFAISLGFSQLFFVYNFFYSMIAGKKAADNPWQIGTLEWTAAPSPPPHGNFDKIPVVVRGPHDFANPDVKKRLDRDWLGQEETFAKDTPPADNAAAQ